MAMCQLSPPAQWPTLDVRWFDHISHGVISEGKRYSLAAPLFLVAFNPKTNRKKEAGEAGILPGNTECEAIRSADP